MDFNKIGALGKIYFFSAFWKDGCVLFVLIFECCIVVITFSFEVRIKLMNIKR